MDTKIKAKFEVDGSQGLILPFMNSTEFTPGEPHIWLDPILAKEQIEKIGDGF